MTTKQVKQALANVTMTIHLSSRKDEAGQIEYTARKGFFYSHGAHAEDFAQTIRETIPAATIIACGRVDKPFRGGGTVSQNSHFWVKFAVPAPDAK